MQAHLQSAYVAEAYRGLGVLLLVKEVIDIAKEMSKIGVLSIDFFLDKVRSTRVAAN